MTTFASGISLPDGMAGAPAMCFASDATTGLFFNNRDIATLSVAVENNTLLIITPEQVTFTKNVQLVLNAFAGAVLTSDEHGNASWQVPRACPEAAAASAADPAPSVAPPADPPAPVLTSAGMIVWNSIYTDLNFTQKSYKKVITFPQAFASVPTVILTKETTTCIGNTFNLYITNKTTTEFSIYSNLNMFATLLDDVVGAYSSVRLYVGGIGVAYFSKSTGKVMYVYIDDTFTTTSVPIVIDTLNSTGLVSMVMVGTTPAIAYTVYNNTSFTYELRYVVASDMLGVNFYNPTLLYNTTSSANQQTSSLVLVTILSVPNIYFTIETGAVVVFVCNNLYGFVFNVFVQISNLMSHTIMSVQIFNNAPTVLAVNTLTNELCYVQKTDVWPDIALLFTIDNNALLVSHKTQSSTMSLIGGVVTIIVSQFATNTLYSIAIKDTFTPTLLILNNNPTPFVRLFTNGGVAYLLYNAGVDIDAVKTLLQFNDDGTIATKTDRFITTLNAQNDNQFVQNKNKNDNDNAIIINTDTSLVLLRFFSNDFIINWIAIA